MLTIAAVILQEDPIFVLDDLTLRVRDGLEQIFTNVALLDDVVPEGPTELEAVSLQRNPKYNLLELEKL